MIEACRRFIVRKALQWWAPLHQVTFPEINPADQMEPLWLSRFGALWVEIRQQVPRWQRTDVPDFIRSYSEFKQVPLTQRKDLQNDLAQFINPAYTKTISLSTGGSTGRPLKFPAINSELEVGRKNQIYARQLYGIRPGDPCLCIWGQATALDRRMAARVDEFKRSLKDLLLGYHRVSAYCLNQKILVELFEEFLRRPYSWIYSYAKSLLFFVRANHPRRNQARAKGLKACIAASEPLTSEEKAEIEDFFNCRLGMEYGSVEMRVCAHTHPQQKGYFVFTNDYLIEALPTPIPGTYDVAVTKLFRSAMPLVRYVVGDQIIIDQPGFVGGPISGFDDVLGRSNDNLVLPDGTEIHSETITHAVRQEGEVLAYQLHQNAAHLEFHLVTRNGNISSGLQERIRTRLALVHPCFSNLAFRSVDDVETTSAAKRRWIIRH